MSDTDDFEDDSDSLTKVSSAVVSSAVAPVSTISSAVAPVSTFTSAVAPVSTISSAVVWVSTFTSAVVWVSKVSGSTVSSAVILGTLVFFLNLLNVFFICFFFSKVVSSVNSVTSMVGSIISVSDSTKFTIGLPFFSYVL